MNNVLGDALSKALDAKKNDYSSFIWKGEKKKDGEKFTQDSVRLIDMSPEELKKCYNHCQKMLYNDNPKHLGRFNVLEEVNEEINKCNVELFLRYCENSYKADSRKRVERRSLWLSLRQFMENSNKALVEAGKPEVEDWYKIAIGNAMSNLPEEFEDISIGSVLDGCIDYLGIFSKQHLTMTFITKMGLWFSKTEEKEFKGEGVSIVDKLRTVKERLHLPAKLILRLSEKGLSYREMRAMLTLPKKQKYSDMTTEQLTTLRNKVLLRLQKEVDGHIFSWNRLKKQIELVAKSKKINLNGVD